MKLSLVAALFTLCVSLECKPFICSDLEDDDLCAKITDDKVLINQNGCVHSDCWISSIKEMEQDAGTFVDCWEEQFPVDKHYEQKEMDDDWDQEIVGDKWDEKWMKDEDDDDSWMDLFDDWDDWDKEDDTDWKDLFDDWDDWKDIDLDDWEDKDWEEAVEEPVVIQDPANPDDEPDRIQDPPNPDAEPDRIEDPANPDREPQGLQPADEEPEVVQDPGNPDEEPTLIQDPDPADFNPDRIEDPPAEEAREYKTPEELINMDQEDQINAANDILNENGINPDDIDLDAIDLDELDLPDINLDDMDKDEVVAALAGAVLDWFMQDPEEVKDWDDDWFKEDEDDIGWEGNYDDMNQDDLDDDAVIECGEPDDEVSLLTGTYPKQCEGDEDCLLINGDYGQCECSVDGLSYCVPHFEDADVLPQYWDACTDGETTMGMMRQRIWYLENFNDFGKLPCYDVFPDELQSRVIEDDVVGAASSSSSSFAAAIGIALVLILS